MFQGGKHLREDSAAWAVSRRRDFAERVATEALLVEAARARLRDEFAMAALTGIIMRVGVYEGACEAAYEAADAMLEARARV